MVFIFIHLFIHHKIDRKTTQYVKVFLRLVNYLNCHVYFIYCLILAEVCESVENGLLSLPLTLPLGFMSAGQISKKIFFMKSNTLATRSLIIKV